MDTLKGILIVDDEEDIRHSLSIILGKEGYRIATAANSEETFALLQKNTYDIILLDIKMPGMDGLSLLKKIKEMGCDSQVIIMSAYGSIDTAIEAIKLGAYDYICKPFKTDEVILTLKKLEERERLKDENIMLRERLREISFEGILSSSKNMIEIFNNIKKIAAYKTTVLIIGESGTGKELIARAIHKNSPRADGPFIAINCGAIPNNLLESELFGHEKGAFTDASNTKHGLFEAADKGTIFLDEIGEMDISLQVKLLRVIQNGTIRRLGSSLDIPIDTRIISATLKDLEEKVKEGSFREDLFYRLNVVCIHLPPLRERRSDIPALVSYFIGKYNNRHVKNVKGVDKKAMEYMLTYSWKGNIRELENVIERGVLLCNGDTITLEDIKENMDIKADSEAFQKDDIILPLKKARQSMEKEIISAILTKTGGNRREAARLLGISYRGLLYKIKEISYKD